MECPLIELRKVSKFFPGVIALNKADLKLYSGEVHGLMGENGAGKSTLIKLLTGAYKPDEGEMLLDGQPLKVNGPKDAMNMGLTAIYQELNVIPKLTVWENIFLGRELRNKKGLLDIPQMKERAKELLQQLRQNIDVDEKVENLGMGHQQMVEICKALVLESRLIIMDEPTSSLSAGETEELLRTARELRDRGMAIVFISHHMDEIFRICDRLTVLRDGCVIQSMLAKDTNTENLIKLMVGRDINQQFPKIVAAKKEELLRIEDFTSEDGSFKDISFSVCGGEVLGFAGLVGAGRTEVMRAIFGADARKTGKVYVKGKEADIRSPKAAISYGIAFLTEDRKGEGLVLSNTVGFNINLSTFETLGMQNVARGLALIVTGAAPVSSFPKSVQFLGNSMVGVVPMSIIFVAIVAVVFYIFLNRTAIGKHIYAIGGNAEAAKLSGINIDKTIIIVYTICGFMAALGGIVQMGRVDSAFPLAGTGYELNAVASVVIGGASMKGGSGTVSGTIIGAMVIAVLNNGLNLLHVSTYAQQIALGIVIIGAVYVDVLRERLGSKAKKN